MSDRKEILFEKFRIDEYLKKDSFSSVYLADHIYLEKKIILKTLDTESLPDNSILERFKREARILAGLDHPNIIKVLDFGMYQKYFYISFEYYESRNVRKVIKENNLNTDQKLSLLVQLLQGLKEAHSKHIIHRDIKPENILVNERYELKIADFGLATISDELNVTNQYSIVGTPGYMSPEQIRGENLSCQTDLFSAGIVAYELLTAVNPFIGRDINETINKILENSDAYLNNLPELPVPVRSVIRKLLDKNPASRYTSADQALNDLGITQTIVEENTAPIHKKKTLLFAAVPLLIAAAIIMFFILRNSDPSDIINAQNKNITQTDAGGIDSTSEEINQPANLITENNKEEKIEEPEKESVNNTFAAKNNDPLPVNDFSQAELTGRGELFIECIPWAAIFIDSQKIDTTPLKKNIQLPAGDHTVVLIHPDYPPYSTRVKIEPDRIHQIKFRFDSVVGYLNCMVHPWGEVFINGESKGNSPLRKPIALAPGGYTLTIKNPNFSIYTEFIRILKNDTLHLKVNLSDDGN